VVTGALPVIEDYKENIKSEVVPEEEDLFNEVEDEVHRNIIYGNHLF
jgi:hypothetical protein